MNPLLRLRHRWSTRLAILIAILFFSATAVEVAPHAIDVLQDLGWLAPDAAEAPAEAAALPQPEDTRLSGSGTLAEVDDVAVDRLTRFTETLPGSLQDIDAYTGESDETDAAELLEGVVSLDLAPEANAGGWSSGGSGPARADFAAMTTAAAGTAPDTSVLVGAPGADGELASTKTETKTDTTSTDKTASVGTTAGSASTSAAPPAEGTSGDKADSSAGYALAEAPRGESGTGGAASAVAEISPVAVPEPATLFLLGGGLLFVARCRTSRYPPSPRLRRASPVQ
jgi:hypothetical protein